MAHHPRLQQRLRRWLFAHATLFYLGSVALLSALRGGARGGRRAGGAGAALDAGSGWALVALLPASDLAVALVQRLVHRIARPRRLPRLDLRGGVPEAARTMVIVPTLLSSRRGRAGAGRAPRGARAREPRTRASTSRCSPTSRTRRAEHLPGEDEALAAAVAGIEALNARYAPETRGPLLPVPPGAPVEPERGRVDGLGAQARQDRGVQPAAARRHRHQLRRAGRRPRDPAAASATASRSTATRACRATRRGS